MTVGGKIISTIIAALAVWIVTRIAGYFIERGRLKAGLLTDIELHIKSIRESDNYLDKWLPTLTVGERIEHSARHTPDEYNFFHSVTPELPKYFSRSGFSMILRFYKSIKEHDVLLGGFFADVSAWKEDRRQLSDKDIQYLTRKAERIKAVGDLIATTNPQRLSDLKRNYSLKKGPTTIIMGE